ncbi:unnamed protein product [Auanema sp. JU1783]|nr:unnamed protein product [Auanema sp. JU1783]
MQISLFIITFLFIGCTSSNNNPPWYLPIIEYFEPLLAKEIVAQATSENCRQECTTTMDCSTGLSCFQATEDKPGCCLPALKPNETGCILDDQCKRACESTICDKTQQISRCLCEEGRHFLFNKCWKKCPAFAHPEPIVDALGFSRCELKTDLRTAVGFMRRMKRQMRSNFC